MEKIGIQGLTIKKIASASFWKETLEGQYRKMGREKKETRMLPSKVHNCRCLRRKLWKEKWMRKVGIQDRPSKIQIH